MEVFNKYPNNIKTRYYKFLLLEGDYIKDELHYHALIIIVSDSKYWKEWTLPINSIESFIEMKRFAKIQIRKLKLDKINEKSNM